MRRILTVAEMTLRDLLRRRAVVGLLFAIPLVFYLARRGDHTGQATRFLLLGLGFTVSSAGLFATSAMRSLEPRLRIAGYPPVELYLGRLAALLAAGLTLATPYLLLVWVDQDVPRTGALALALGLTVVVAAPLGMLLGSVLARDMEGVLLLLGVIAGQFLLDPARTSGKLMPFWSSREIGTYAVDPVDVGYLQRGVTHALAVAAMLFAATAVIAIIRLRGKHPVGAAAAGAPAVLHTPGRTGE